MITVSYEIASVAMLSAGAGGYIAAVLFSVWLNKSIEKSFVKKQAVKPWPTDERGHPNRRTGDKQEGVTTIYGYQPHTNTDKADSDGAALLQKSFDEHAAIAINFGHKP